MIDVAFFLPSLGNSGAERSAVLLANGLASRGLKIGVVVATSEMELSTQLSESISIESLSSRRVRRAIPRLVSYLEKNNPKTLLSFMAHANAAAILASLCSRSRTKVIVFERTSLASLLQQSNGFQILYQCIIRQLYRLANKIIANSEGGRRDLNRIALLPLSKISLLLNGIDYQGVSFKAQSKIPMSEENLFRKKRVVLSVGRLVVEKNHAALIRIFSRLNRLIDYHLIIIGDGPERENLIAMIDELNIENSVSMLGHVTNPYPYMRLSRIFAHTSSREGFPNVILEAMACGASIVAYDCRWGPSEILEGGKWGRLVELGNEDSFLVALEDLLSSPENQNVIQRAKEFDMNITTDNLLEILAT